jgi:cell wall-associated NlpC family hydrolase
MEPTHDKRARRGLAAAAAAAPAAAVVALLCAALLLWPGPPSAAASPTVVVGANASLADLQRAADKVQRQVAALDDQMEIVVERYDQAQSRLDEAGGELSSVRLELQLRESELEAQQELLSQRLVWMYKYGTDSLLDSLLMAGSLTAAESQVEFFGRLTRQDDDLRSRFLTLTEQVRQLEATAAARRDDLQQAEQKVEEIKQAVEDKLAQRQSILDGLDKRIKVIIERRDAAAARLAARLGREAGLDLTKVAGTPAQIAVVRESLKYLGIPYVWGGATPQQGFDCSGLVQYVYARFGVPLVHFAATQATQGTPVPLSQLEPADLLFWGNPIHHVGIYAGNGLFVEAPHTGDVVKVASLAGYETPSMACRYAIQLR